MFDKRMNRVSLFLPSYMEDLIAMVAAKEGVAKAAFIRKAILKELEMYAADVALTSETDNHGPVKSDADHDYEENNASPIYDKFKALASRFPQAVRLR
jgi:hypothetical protein